MRPNLTGEPATIDLAGTGSGLIPKPIATSREEALKILQPAAIQNKFRREVVRSALALVGSKSFRSKEVKGGILACAKVMSTILIEADYPLARVHIAIRFLVEELLSDGWTKSDIPQVGNVVVWNKVAHHHIGVVVGDNQAVSNSSIKRKPVVHRLGLEREDLYWYYRGIEHFLSPPNQDSSLRSE